MRKRMREREKRERERERVVASQFTTLCVYILQAGTCARCARFIISFFGHERSLTHHVAWASVDAAGRALLLGLAGITSLAAVVFLTKFVADLTQGLRGEGAEQLPSQVEALEDGSVGIALRHESGFKLVEEA